MNAPVRPADLAALRTQVADACRVLASRGLADGILGHISLRIDDSTLLVRCRGAQAVSYTHLTLPTNREV